MVQFCALSGAGAGAAIPVRRFPCIIGRGPSADLRLEQPGVWDAHVQIDLEPGQGFVLSVLPGALATVNYAPVERVVLRSGDVIEIGAAKLRFAFVPTRQSSFRLREALTWVGIALLCALQVFIIYRLLR